MLQAGEQKELSPRSFGYKEQLTLKTNANKMESI